MTHIETYNFEHPLGTKLEATLWSSFDSSKVRLYVGLPWKSVAAFFELDTLGPNARAKDYLDTLDLEHQVYPKILRQLKAHLEAIHEEFMDLAAISTSLEMHELRKRVSRG